MLYTYLPLNINSKYVTHMSASLAKSYVGCTPVFINNSADTFQPPRYIHTGSNTVKLPLDQHGSQLVSRPKDCNNFSPGTDNYNSQTTMCNSY